MSTQLPEENNTLVDLEEREKKQRQRLFLLLLFLSLLLICVGVLFLRYLQRPAPLPDLLPLPVDISYPPHYLFSIYEVNKPIGVALSPGDDRIYVAEAGGERMIRMFDRDGDPLRPYDLATHTMAEFMGVRVDPIDEPVQGEFQVLTEGVNVSGVVEPGGSHYALDGRQNASFKAVNLLLDSGVEVRRIDKATSGLRAGDFVLSSGSEAVLKGVAQQTGVSFRAVSDLRQEGTHELRRLRVGLYQRYWGGNMDEGWTRLVLEQFAFPYSPDPAEVVAALQGPQRN